ncbi:MAG: YfhO family protein [Elusimicrobiota bacterium]
MEGIAAWGHFPYFRSRRCLETWRSDDRKQSGAGFFRLKNIRWLIFLFVNILIIFLSPIIFNQGIFANAGDVFYHYYPLRQFAQLQLSSGHFPFWNPFIFAGMPFQANIQTAIFYPLNLIFYFLPLTLSFNLTVFLHILLGGVFLCLLGKAIRLKKPAFFILALNVCFSFFLLSRIAHGHLLLFSAYQWLPLIIALSFRVKEGFLPALIFSLACSLQVLAGHPQAFYLTLFTLFWFALVYKNRTRNLCLGLFFVFLLTAIQLLPTGELESKAQRSMPGGWGYVVASSYSLPLKNLVNLIRPDFWGSPLKDAQEMLKSVYFELHCLYLGIVVFIFYLFSIYHGFKRKKTRLDCFLFSLNGGSLLFALGSFTPLYYLNYLFFPGISHLRVPARFFYLFLFSAVLLAVVQLQKFISTKSRKKLWFSGIILFLLFELFILNHKFIAISDLDKFRPTKVIQFLQEKAANFRIATLDDLPNPNKVMLYHLENVDGYEATIPQRYIQYLGKLNGRPFSNTARGEITNYHSPYLDLLAVKYLVTTQKIKDLPLVFNDGELKVYENKNTAEKISLYSDDYRRELPCEWKLSISSLNKFKLALSNPSMGNLLISNAYFPGWTLYDNGKKGNLEPFYSLLEKTYVKKGEHKIYLIYHPLSFKIGLYCSLFVWVLLIYWMFLRIRKCRGNS